MEQHSTQDLVVDKEGDVKRLLVDKEVDVERDKLIVHSVAVAALGVGKLLDSDQVVVGVVAVEWWMCWDREQDADVGNLL